MLPAPVPRSLSISRLATFSGEPDKPNKRRAQQSPPPRLATLISFPLIGRFRSNCPAAHQFRVVTLFLVATVAASVVVFAETVAVVAATESSLFRSNFRPASCATSGQASSLSRVFVARDQVTGGVCSPPVRSRPLGHIEAASLLELDEMEGEKKRSSLYSLHFLYGERETEVSARVKWTRRAVHQLELISSANFQCPPSIGVRLFVFLLGVIVISPIDSRCSSSGISSEQRTQLATGNWAIKV